MSIFKHAINILGNKPSVDRFAQFTEGNLIGNLIPQQGSLTIGNEIVSMPPKGKRRLLCLIRKSKRRRHLTDSSSPHDGQESQQPETHHMKCAILNFQVLGEEIDPLVGGCKRNKGFA